MLQKDELVLIVGGKLTATMLSALIRGANLLLDAGRAIGTAIRRIKSGKKCPV